MYIYNANSCCVICGRHNDSISSIIDLKQEQIKMKRIQGKQETMHTMTKRFMWFEIRTAYLLHGERDKLIHRN